MMRKQIDLVNRSKRQLKTESRQTGVRYHFNRWRSGSGSGRINIFMTIINQQSTEFTDSHFTNIPRPTSEFHKIFGQPLAPRSAQSSFRPQEIQTEQTRRNRIVRHKTPKFPSRGVTDRYTEWRCLRRSIISQNRSIVAS
jgi:hypothetical protein